MTDPKGVVISVDARVAFRRDSLDLEDENKNFIVNQ